MTRTVEAVESAMPKNMHAACRKVKAQKENWPLPERRPTHPTEFHSSLMFLRMPIERNRIRCPTPCPHLNSSAPSSPPSPSPHSSSRPRLKTTKPPLKPKGPKLKLP